MLLIILVAAGEGAEFKMLGIEGLDLLREGMDCLFLMLACGFQFAALVLGGLVGEAG